MKRNYLSGLLLATFSIAFCSTHAVGQNQYDIKGKINGVDSGVIRLQYINLQNFLDIKFIDSAKINHHSFELKGHINSPQMVTVSIMPGDFRFNFFVENSRISITADTTKARHEDYSADGMGKPAFISNYSVSGSQNNSDWDLYQKAPEFKKFTESRRQFNTDTSVNSQIKSRERTLELRKNLQAWQKSYIDNYVAQHPSSVAGVYMVYDLYRWLSDTRIELLNSELDKFTGEAKSSDYFVELSGALSRLKSVQPGIAPPDFTLRERDNSIFNLASFAKGKYIMIDFWASWCHPCRESIPHWKTIYQEYHDKGFDIVSVSIDKKYNNWLHALDVEKMPWVQVIDVFKNENDIDPSTYNRYNNAGVPRYILLDKDGKVVISTFEEADIDKKLKEFLN